MAQETIAEYNVLYTNPDKIIEGDLLKIAKHASVIVLSEAADPAGVASAVAKLGWQHYNPTLGDVQILWNPKVWSSTADQRIVKCAPGAKEYGLDYKVNPARYCITQGLQHKASAKNHLFYGTHTVAGYAAPAGKYPADLAKYKDFAAEKHFIQLVRITAADLIKFPEYQFQHLLGDLNASQGKTDEWYYPSRILTGLYVQDAKIGKLDYIMHSEKAAKNGLVVTGRSTMGKADGLHSDHEAQLKTIRF